jgi:hypothetical protein
MERNFKVLQGEGMNDVPEVLDTGLTFVYVTTNRGEDMILGLSGQGSTKPLITTGTDETGTEKAKVLKIVEEGGILEVEYAILLLPTSANSYQMAPYEGPLNAGRKYMNTKNFVTLSFDLEHGIRTEVQKMIDTLIRQNRSGIIVSKSNLTM